MIADKRRRYTKSVFIFRRDLRLHDNTALNVAVEGSAYVIPCFIFDPRQINKHPYQSQPALKFMRKSLGELQEAFCERGARLTLFAGLPTDVIRQIFEVDQIQAVFVNRDYTPFSKKRDQELVQLCQTLNIDLRIIPDYLLIEPEQAVKKNGEPYQVFTAFYNHAKNWIPQKPSPLPAAKFISSESNTALDQLIALQNDPDKNHLFNGGRKQALSLLGQLNKHINYTKERDYPALDATSKLSSHLKFGTCSVREAYFAIAKALGTEHPLLRQLYWRDFFTHIAFHYPQVFGKSFYQRYDELKWDNNIAFFNCWREGMTGFPIVDAGMRELNNTGFMHNRVRMIVASFLIKDLHISWRWGERYFAQYLLDYDPAVNNGNWQWVASTGCDAQPYFRIFNPWLQQQKFDPDCQYIYRWIPELNSTPINRIHRWYDCHTEGLYPAPMVDHSKESQVAKQRYSELITGKEADL